MSTRHRAARVEDWGNTRVGSYLRRRGWTPGVLGYTSYGVSPGSTAVVPGAEAEDGGAGAAADPSSGWVRVLGRVVHTRPLRNGEPDDVTPEEGEPLGSAAVKALRGWRSFVTAPVVGARVEVLLDGERHTVTSDRGGYLDAVVPAHLPAGDHELQLRVLGDHEDAGRAPQHPAPTPSPAVRAPVVVVSADERYGIVSDIDDTVMVTALPRPLLAAWNTFVLYPQARHPVPGMAQALSQAVAAHPGAPVVYLSTGAWNVAPTLVRFLARHGFPPGPMLLTDWGPTNSGWFRSGREHKHAALRRLGREMPHVQWLLVGDDGQHDPEIYGEFAQDCPDQVRTIAIRQLTPTEQVLSHGLPVPVTHRAHGATAPVVQGPDGLNILRQLRGAGLL